MSETEKRNPKTTHIDKMDTMSMLKIINEENMNSVKAVENALESIEKAVDILDAPCIIYTSHEFIFIARR